MEEGRRRRRKGQGVLICPVRGKEIKQEKLVIGVKITKKYINTLPLLPCWDFKNVPLKNLYDTFFKNSYVIISSDERTKYHHYY